MVGVFLLIMWAGVERMFVFFPTSEVTNNPGMVGLEFEDVHFDTTDGRRLHGWYIPGTSEITWLFFHGNGGNIGHRVEEIEMINRRLGVNVFIFDYQGYGKSQGQPSEKGTYQDARAALQYLRSRSDVTPEKIVYFGRSLGAAVSVELAVEHPPAGLILVVPFASLKDMARTVYPMLPLASWLAGNRYNSLDRIAKINSPLLIIHGDQDEIVPSSQGLKLFQTANWPKRFHSLPYAGHNDTYVAGGEEYWNALKSFMDTLD